MSKAEWAAWAQVGVGALAIFAAWKAVQAAHRLATEGRKSERRNDRLTNEFFEVDLLYRQLHTLVQAGEQLVRELEPGRDIDSVKLALFTSLTRPILQASYGGHSVAELVDPLALIQLNMRKAHDALHRHVELTRRRSSVGHSKAKDEAVAGVEAARAELPKFDAWLVRQSKHLRDVM